MNTDQVQGKVNTWGNAKDDARKTAEQGTNKTNEPANDFEETSDDLYVPWVRRVS
jgi:hypothetical protein